MAKKNLWLGILAIALVFTMTNVGCDNGTNSNKDPNKPVNPDKPDETLTSIDAFATWLNAQPENTPATAYTIKLNVSDLGGIASAAGSLGNMLYNGRSKYVYLDLSGSTITTIPDSTFYAGYTAAGYISCETLTGITIPNSVIGIGQEAFRDCNNLASITIGNSVTTIGSQAFRDCNNLTSVTIPNSVTSIGWGAFSGSSLISVTIPDSVTSIGAGAFSDCTSLAIVTIGNSVTTIEEGAFRDCTSLAIVTIPNIRKTARFT